MERLAQPAPTYCQVSTTNKAKAKVKTPVATSAESLVALGSATPPAHVISEATAKTSDHTARGRTRKMSFSPPDRLIEPRVTNHARRKQNASGANAEQRRQSAKLISDDRIVENRLGI